MAVTRALLNKTIRVLVSFEEMPRIYVAKKTVSIHHFDIGSVARLILNYLVRFLVGGGICGQKWPEIASPVVHAPFNCPVHNFFLVRVFARLERTKTCGGNLFQRKPSFVTFLPSGNRLGYG